MLIILMITIFDNAIDDATIFSVQYAPETQVIDMNKFNSILLKLLREANGLTQNGVCKDKRFNQAPWSKWERGLATPTEQMIDRIADVFKYPREFLLQPMVDNLNRLGEIVYELRDYFAVAGFDLSPCVNDPIEEQQLALLLNSSVNAYLMANGVQVVPSLRTGGLATLGVLRTYPEDIAYAVGVLGCHRGARHTDEMLFHLQVWPYMVR